MKDCSVRPRLGCKLESAEVALLQPLPALAFTNGLSAYSEFSSLGLAILGGALRAAGATIREILYPATVKNAVLGVGNANAVVLGDFRYYSYFCNPLPLIRAICRGLAAERFDGMVIVAGRHSRFMRASLTDTATAGLQLRICPTMVDVADALGLPELTEYLGNDILPCPAEAPVDLVLGSAMRGSSSRPTSGTIAQILLRSGCANQCGFCEQARRSIAQITLPALRRQLAALHSGGATYLIVWDGTLGEPWSGHEDALLSLQEAGLPFACNTRAELVTEAFARRLAACGCRAALLGVEVAPPEERLCDQLRLRPNKAVSMTFLRTVVERLRRYSIDPIGSILIGLPDDDQEQIETRIHACQSLPFAHVYIRPLVPFPESLLYRQQVSAGRLAPYCRWPAEQWGSYPHGYPTLSTSIDRGQLCAYATPAH